jgi:excisionase family DNA binding protein
MPRRTKSYTTRKREAATTAPALRLYTLGEFAVRRGVTVMTLRRWLSQGRMPPPRQIGRTWFFTHADVESMPATLPGERGQYPTAAAFASAAGYLGTDE